MVDTLGNAPSECKDSDFTGRTASLTGYVSNAICYLRIANMEAEEGLEPSDPSL